jgi:hypothetical protein
MRFHSAPVPCGHDSTLPCFTCGEPRGYRWTGDDGKAGGRAIECWFCAWGRPRPQARPVAVAA